MDWFNCYNKNCPNFYKREIKGLIDYMCTARRGRKVRPLDLGSGRLIQIKNLRECPLDNPEKHFRFDKKMNNTEFAQEREKLLEERKLIRRKMAELMTNYTNNCPESNYIGKRVKGYIGTCCGQETVIGYLKEIKWNCDGNFWFVLYKEKKDGTPSSRIYIGDKITKIEVL